MAKKVTAMVKLQIPAGKATPAPPVGLEAVRPVPIPESRNDKGRAPSRSTAGCEKHASEVPTSVDRPLGRGVISDSQRGYAAAS